MDLNTTMTIVFAVLGAVCGLYHFIDSRGGRVYLDDLKREVCKK